MGNQMSEKEVKVKLKEKRQLQEKKEKTTVKKVKAVGTKTVIDPVTLEEMVLQVTTVEERDYNFMKVWMRSFLTTLEIVGNAKTKVAYWVVDHINRENQLTYTYRQIAEETGMSLDTVTATMKALLEADFLKRKNQGCYMLNPNIVFKGSNKARLNVLTQYSSLDSEKPKQASPEEQLQNLMKTIKAMTAKAEKLSAEIKSKQPEQPEQMSIDDFTEETKDYAGEEHSDTDGIAS